MADYALVLSTHHDMYRKVTNRGLSTL